MKKGKIEQKIRKITGYCLIILSGWKFSQIAGKGQIKYTPIKVSEDSLLWIGVLILAVLIFGIAMMVFKKNPNDNDDDNINEEEPEITNYKLDKYRIIEEILAVVFVIITVIFQQIAMGYRPSKVHHVTPEYSFWVLIFWVSLLWTIIYVIIIEIKRNLKRKE